MLACLHGLDVTKAEGQSGQTLLDQFTRLTIGKRQSRYMHTLSYPLFVSLCESA